MLLGAAATRAAAAVVAGVIDVSSGGPWIVERRAIADQVIETLAVTGPVAVIVGNDDAMPAAPSDSPAPVISTTLSPSALAVTSTEAVGTTNGLMDARTVVSFGRGVGSRDDIALVEQLAVVLDAEIVAAVNADPEAPVFRTADYGVVGDLHQVVPELIATLQQGPNNNPRSVQNE